MLIKPKIRGFICTAAHPQGCFKAVEEQVNYIKSQKPFIGPKNVLVIGASTGYGLASRIAATFGGGANTIGVFFEKPAAGKRTASAGWYNTAAFETLAQQAGYYAKSINGDAFSDDIKQQTIELIRQDLKQIDLVVYSLASPRRTDPKTGETYTSVLKTVDQTYVNKTVDPLTGDVKEVTIEPGDQADIDNTVAVMGGADWQLWIDALQQAGVLAEGATTVAYSYIGPELTYPVYKNGTIGKAKDHLYETAKNLAQQLQPLKGRALVSINKAVVTQSSAAIPVVPLYISILFKIMKTQGSHEGCIEQMYRMFHDNIYTDKPKNIDPDGHIRVDNYEMQADIQQKVIDVWQQVNANNIDALADLSGYRQDFYRLFGFDFPNINYDSDVDPNVAIPSIKE